MHEEPDKVDVALEKVALKAASRLEVAIDRGEASLAKVLGDVLRIACQERRAYQRGYNTGFAMGKESQASS